MAIYLPEHNSLYLHVPKCGGFWVDEALRRVGIARQHVPSPADETRADCHCRREDFDGDPDLVFTFIRHPVAWYESVWKYQSGQPHNWDSWEWHPMWPLRDLRHHDFPSFIDLVLKHCPGFLTRMYEWYAGDLANPHALIGCVERMPCDFCVAMVAMGWTSNLGVVPWIEPQHRSNSPVGRPVWRSDQQDAICYAEHKIIERFYPDDESLFACRAPEVERSEPRGGD